MTNTQAAPKVTEAQVIEQCKSEILTMIDAMCEAGYSVEADDMANEFQCCDSVFDWCDLREEAAKWADGLGVDLW